MVGSAVILTTTIGLAAADLPAKVFVDWSGNVASLGGRARGVTPIEFVTGEAYSLERIGIAEVVVGAASISKGALVASDANGKAKTKADGETVLGIAEADAPAGGIAQVFLTLS